MTEESKLLVGILTGVSFAALGVVCYLIYRNISNAIRLSGHERRLEASYAMARAGLVVTVGLITEAVFHQPGLEYTWRVGLYIAGLLAITLGYVGIAIEGKKVQRRDK